MSININFYWRWIVRITEQGIFAIMIISYFAFSYQSCCSFFYVKLNYFRRVIDQCSIKIKLFLKKLIKKTDILIGRFFILLISLWLPQNFSFLRMNPLITLTWVLFFALNSLFKYASYYDLMFTDLCKTSSSQLHFPHPSIVRHLCACIAALIHNQC